MVSKIFLTALDKYGDEMNLEMTEHEVLIIINLLWERRRNRMLGARFIDFFRDLGTEQEHILKEEKQIDMKKVLKKVKEFRRIKGI